MPVSSMRRRFSLREANPLGGLMQLRKFPMVTGLAVAFVFAALAHAAAEIPRACWRVRPRAPSTCRASRSSGCYLLAIHS